MDEKKGCGEKKDFDKAWDEMRDRFISEYLWGPRFWYFELPIFVWGVGMLAFIAYLKLGGVR